MKRALVFCMALSLCFIALDLKPEVPPLAKKVDHFYLVSDKAQALFSDFKDTFQLPEV